MTRNNTHVEFVRSKFCKFGCGSRVYYSMHGGVDGRGIWCSDSDLKVKHSCDKWTPSDKAKEEAIDTLIKKVSDIEFQTNKNSNLLIEIRLKLNACLEKQNG